jgi:hypothetical protein
MLGRVWAPLLQGSEGVGPLPVDPPIGGPVWTVLIPGVLFIGSFLGTYLLYRRFSREGGDGGPSDG